jgi:hypothetical protein
MRSWALAVYFRSKIALVIKAWLRHGYQRHKELNVAAAENAAARLLHARWPVVLDRTRRMCCSHRYNFR